MAATYATEQRKTKRPSGRAEIESSEATAVPGRGLPRYLQAQSFSLEARRKPDETLTAPEAETAEREAVGTVQPSEQNSPARLGTPETDAEPAGVEHAREKNEREEKSRSAEKPGLKKPAPNRSDKAPTPATGGGPGSQANTALISQASQGPAAAGVSALGGGGAAGAGMAGASGGGGAVSIDLGNAGGDAGGAEETAAAGQTEERMDRASPEQAEADAAAEAEENPEAEAAVVPETSADASATAVFAPDESETSVQNEPRKTRANEETSAPPEPLAPAAPAAENVSAESAEPTGSQAGLDAGEQQAAFQSIGESGAGGEPSGGGGGGGGAIPEAPAAEVPDVSSQPPEAGIAAAQSLPPVQAAEAIGGIGRSVSREAQEKSAEMTANPPEMERPSGSPVTKSGPTAPSDLKATGARPTKAQQGGASKPTPAPAPTPTLGPSPVSRIPSPPIASSGDAPLGAGEAQAMQSAVRNLPTSDAALSADPGPPPQLALQGDANPAQVQDQRGQLDHCVRESRAEGARDAAQPMGEKQIYPVVPRETLRAQSGAEGAAGGAAAGEPAGAPVAAGDPASDAASFIAEQQKGPEIRAAAAQAREQMAAQRETHAQKVTEERASNQREIAQAEQENADQQEAARSGARAEVAQARGAWSKEQQTAVDKADTEATREQQQGAEKISSEEQQANAEAAQHIEHGTEEAGQVRAEAEQKAASKQREADEESDGVFGWLASKAKAFFNAIKNAITIIFDAARKLVKAVIDKAKQLAVAVIEKARQAIVSVIRAVGAALMAIGDVLLAAFPALRDKWRRFIQQKVSAAEAAVNRLADALKAGVQKLLDLLGKALDAALGLLQKGLLAAVDAYSAVLQGAIKAAKAVADALGAFLVLVKHVAAAPGAWLRNLGAAVVDGIRNHLWKAFKTAIKNWFNEKLEEVLGIGGMIWGVLRKGGIAVAEVGKMAWEGLKAAIPVALITILVEKLVAMIVPAAGAVMAIIEGLQAAWGTVSRIIAAFGKFFAFLKAVKTGKAGPQFADAVAAAAVVVIDFVANWLLKKIRKPAGKIGGKIKAIAQKIMARLKRVGSRVGQAMKKVGKKALAPFQKAKDKLKALREKRRAKKPDANKKQQDKEAAKRKKQERAKTETKATLERSLARGLPLPLLKAQVQFLKLRWGWGTLGVNKTGPGKVQITGGFSPVFNIINGSLTITGVTVGSLVHKISDLGAATTSGRSHGAGASWEMATTPFVRGPLSAQIAQQSGAPANLVPQRTIKSHGFKRIPDYMQTQASTASGGPPTLHVVEQTLITNLNVGTGGHFSWHKRSQIPGTIHLLRLQNPGLRIVYHVIVPIAPSAESLAFLEKDLKAVGGDVTVNFQILQR
ncbi:MAG TPA: hypothetical protein VGO90_07730 [Chthoniobacteraceae bacterium]|nr:hypothetical protein [Chthoniobacteraceae bacterium]